MTQINAESKIKIGISHVGDDEYLVMLVSNGAESVSHQISLPTARALSLELIKQVYRAELKNTQNGKSTSSHEFSFQLQTRHQT